MKDCCLCQKDLDHSMVCADASCLRFFHLASSIFSPVCKTKMDEYACCLHYYFFFILKALVALKKGTQLIKYSRQGKPKFCPFRVSPVCTSLLKF